MYDDISEFKQDFNPLLKDFDMIKYARNTYNGSTQKIPSEDTLFYFRWRRRTAVSMTENDGVCWVREHTFVIDDRATSIGNAFDRGSAGLG